MNNLVKTILSFSAIGLATITGSGLGSVIDWKTEPVQDNYSARFKIHDHERYRRNYSGAIIGGLLGISIGAIGTLKIIGIGTQPSKSKDSYPSFLNSNNDDCDNSSRSCGEGGNYCR